MKQQFMRGGKWMTLEKAREYDASQGSEVPEAKPPVVKPEAPLVKPGVPSEAEMLSGDIDSLKAECDAKGIKYHHASGIKKLQELLNNHVIN